MSVKMPIALRHDIPVGVANVENGRRCECVCISCGIDVIARQGEQNEWHFAHAYSDEKIICLHSIEASAKRFAKHVFKIINTLSLPSYFGQASSPAVCGLKLPDKSVRLPETKVVPESIESNVGFESVHVHAAITYHKTPLAIYFSASAPERQQVAVLATLGISVLNIDVTRVDWQTLIDETRFAHYLAEQAPRSWLYHRIGEQRLQALQQQVDAEYAEQKRRQNSEEATSLPAEHTQQANHRTKTSRKRDMESFAVTARTTHTAAFVKEASEADVELRVQQIVDSELRCFVVANGSGRKCLSCELSSIETDGDSCPFCGNKDFKVMSISEGSLRTALQRYRCYFAPRRAATTYPKLDNLELISGHSMMLYYNNEQS